MLADIEAALRNATAQASRDIPLRQNVIEPFTMENSGDNTGWGVPFVHYYYDSEPGPLKLRVELKGFGGEIKSSADWIMTSTRNMEDAVLSYVLNSVILSKGEACLPSFLGVGVGGYAAEAVPNAKNAIFRDLSTQGPATTAFEKRLERCVNALGLGTGGLGGSVTTMGVHVETRGTHTAVSSVAVAHQCWASRGSEALVDGDVVSFITPHLDQAEAAQLRSEVSADLAPAELGTNVCELTTPASRAAVTKLRVGDIVYLTGVVCTARDRAHRRLVLGLQCGEDVPPEIRQSRAIFHCGPVVSQSQCGWSVNAAGPTTSSRFTSDGALLAERGVFNIVVGKGTMGDKMIEALKGRGVYLTAVGGCAVTYQKRIRSASPRWLDLGYPEAVWVFDMERFGPLVVGIDSTGASLSAGVMNQVYSNARDIYREEGLNPMERYAQYPVSLAGLSLEEIIATGNSSPDEG
ncbi:FumA C-terminus/TtdB family hydratase beta subunit [Chloroflexota bacterium]